jgi:hypothetical protein
MAERRYEEEARARALEDGEVIKRVYREKSNARDRDAAAKRRRTISQDFFLSGQAAKGQKLRAN